jgi:hypothetical protein
MDNLDGELEVILCEVGNVDGKLEVTLYFFCNGEAG